MLRFNATQWFLEALDRMSKYYGNKPWQPEWELLEAAIRFQNHHVINRLIGNDVNNMVIMPLPYEMNLLDLCSIVRYGDVDLIQRFIDVNAHRSISCFTLAVLVVAIDNGDVQMVRLLFKHIDFKPELYSSAPKFVKCLNSGGGITVSMLKILNEEYKCLFRCRLWSKVLRLVTRLNMTDSVKYIMDNITLTSMSPELIVKPYQSCLKTAAKLGHIDVFNLLANSIHGFEYVLSKEFKDVINIAADHGQESLIKYIYTHFIGVGMIDKSSEDLVRILLNVPACIQHKNWLIELAGLRMTIPYAIRSNDLVSLESLIQSSDPFQTIDLQPDMIQNMSRAMATYLASPRTCPTQFPLLFTWTSLDNLVSYIAQCHSRIITVDLMLMFIGNCYFDIPPDQEEEGDGTSGTLRTAAGISGPLMNAIHRTFGVDYHDGCFTEALYPPNIDSLRILFDEFVELHNYWDLLYNDDGPSYSVQSVLYSGSLDAVDLLLRQLIKLSNEDEIYWVSRNTLEVFKHVMELYMDNDAPISERKDYQSMIEYAFIHDRVEVVQYLVESAQALGYSTIHNHCASLIHSIQSSILPVSPLPSRITKIGNIFPPCVQGQGVV
ncbi:hypothetical protein SAMD00019534_076520 [Acytostelium subglobosum LB1]|uniref:hypothetical protein n=1 Tax=Acytostelium subglobosum LB1 TaxID=1410327 RepID=UPI000644878A|nr:hypothetical protein SAMD00019534_076520 [Acytostelium subglobosum LB1]GAM24477.1 hypothetical protein SAMD00019534_076520 [Acytostelium subglobosum LB1]|eukprot:XP_012752803.1 hypothetical protein SAMD00019534_076520 [Acytostelium subglobosum LB1]